MYSFSSRKRWAIFISGRGSNLSAIADLRGAMDLALVVSSSSAAPGLLKARRLGIETIVLSKPIDWQKLNEDLQKYRIDFIFLAGFMKLIPENFISRWRERIVNVHPSLLPAYPGLNSIDRAFEEGAPGGVTVHQVIPEVDAGPVIYQRKVQKFDDETLPQHEFMVHFAEHRLARLAVERAVPRTDQGAVGLWK